MTTFSQINAAADAETSAIKDAIIRIVYRAIDMGVADYDGSDEGCMMALEVVLCGVDGEVADWFAAHGVEAF